MMRRLTLIGMLLLPLLMLAGCHGRNREGVPQLQVYIYIPQTALTRADEGSVPSERLAENKIETLQIWVFLHEESAGLPAGTCLGYLAPTHLTLSDGTLNQYGMPLNPAVADAHPDVDVYVLANAASAGHPFLNENTTRAALDALVMDGSVFGVSSNGPTCSSVPDGGLPFAGVGKGMHMRGSYPVLSLDVVTLKRAVSKLRFVFSQLVDDEEPLTDCAVTRILIDGSKIATAEYLFNDSDDPYKIVPNLYESASMTLPGLTAAQIASNTDPEKYAFEEQTAREYEALIQQGIADGELTSCGLSYLRETDRQLTGMVEYMLNGMPGYAHFTMKDPGDFARNHSWIVYFYFTRDAIRFTVSWTPWEEGHDFYLTD